MQDLEFRQIRLADLEWLVIPPIVAGQCRLAHAPPAGKSRTTTGPFLPVAVALWASVSDETDTRLSASHGQPVLLKPNEWTTGDHLWLQAVAGDRRAIPTFLGQLELNDFKGKTVKIRARGRGGTMEVLTLKAYRERMAARLAQAKLH
jgi:cytolysin-activating lysine-acyltransferase